MERMRVKKTFEEELSGGQKLFCELTQMGHDWNICVWGGNLPHIGSVVMSVARPSLTGEGISVTSSVLNGIGHKDECVARKFAEAVARECECTAVCSCGIHVDGITAEEIEDVVEKSEKLLRAVMVEVGTLQE